MVNITNYQSIHITKRKVHLKVETVRNVKKQEWETIGLYISSMNQLKKLKELILVLEDLSIKNGIDFLKVGWFHSFPSHGIV